MRRTLASYSAILFLLANCSRRELGKIPLCEPDGSYSGNKFIDVRRNLIVFSDVVTPADFSCSTATTFCASGPYFEVSFPRKGLKEITLASKPGTWESLVWRINYDQKKLFVKSAPDSEYALSTCKGADEIFAESWWLQQQSHR